MTEEIGEAGGDYTCSIHERSFACDFEGSRNARIRAQKRSRVRGGGEASGAAARRQRPRSAARAAFLATAILAT